MCVTPRLLATASAKDLLEHGKSERLRSALISISVRLFC